VIRHDPWSCSALNKLCAITISPTQLGPTTNILLASSLIAKRAPSIEFGGYCLASSRKTYSVPQYGHNSCPVSSIGRYTRGWELQRSASGIGQCSGKSLWLTVMRRSVGGFCDEGLVLVIVAISRLMECCRRSFRRRALTNRHENCGGHELGRSTKFVTAR